MGVAEFSKTMWQPKGGFLPITAFEEMESDYKEDLLDGESVQGSVMGSLVEALFGYEIGRPLNELSSYFRNVEQWHTELEAVKARNPEYQIPACFLKDENNFKDYSKYKERLKKGLDDESIQAMHSLIRLFGSNCKDAKLNEIDIHNARVMTKRTLAFFKDSVEKIQVFGFTGLKGVTKVMPIAYIIDIITNDGIWDLKVMQRRPNRKQTMQVYLYSLLWNKPNINHIGLFNARTNKGYKLNLKDIDKFTKGYVISSSIEQAIGRFDLPTWILEEGDLIDNETS